MGMNNELRRELIQWGQVHRSRNTLVRKAHKAGVSVLRIHVLTGIPRSVIYAIIQKGGDDALSA